MHLDATASDDSPAPSAQEKSPKPVVVANLGDVMQGSATEFASSGGGIRTPDTRIMIPRDQLVKSFPEAGFDHLLPEVCTYVCTRVLVDEHLAQFVAAWASTSNK